MKVKQGDIIYLLEQIPGEHQIYNGVRPYVVISNNLGNRYSEICLCVPMTSKHKKPLPTRTQISYGNSTCICEQIFTIWQGNIECVVGHVSKFEMKEIKRCVSVAVGIEYERH